MKHYPTLGIIEPSRWFGVPYVHRYSPSMTAPNHLLKAIQKIDPLLDLKFFLPKEKWHVVRYPNGRGAEFVRVWECSENPNLGTRDGLGDWIIDALKMGDLQGAAENRIKEIDDHNDAIEAANDRELDAQCMDFAEEMRKPLQRLEDEGPNATHRKVF